MLFAFSQLLTAAQKAAPIVCTCVRARVSSCVCGGVVKDRIGQRSTVTWLWQHVRFQKKEKRDPNIRCAQPMRSAFAETTPVHISTRLQAEQLYSSNKSPPLPVFSFGKATFSSGITYPTTTKRARIDHLFPCKGNGEQLFVSAPCMIIVAVCDSNHAVFLRALSQLTA